jgi:hypothetical protein
MNVFLLTMPRLDPGRGGGIAEGNDGEGGIGLGPRMPYILDAVLKPRPAAFTAILLPLEVAVVVGGIIEGIAGREGIVVDGGRPERTLPEGIFVVVVVALLFVGRLLELVL